MYANIGVVLGSICVNMQVPVSGIDSCLSQKDLSSTRKWCRWSPRHLQWPVSSRGAVFIRLPRLLLGIQKRIGEGEVAEKGILQVDLLHGEERFRLHFQSRAVKVFGEGGPWLQRKVGAPDILRRDSEPESSENTFFASGMVYI